MNEYKLSLNPHCVSLGVSEEDDPARSRYVDKILREKKRPQSNWKSVLAEPMRHQKWLQEPDEKP